MGVAAVRSGVPRRPRAKTIENVFMLVWGSSVKEFTVYDARFWGRGLF